MNELFEDISDSVLRCAMPRAGIIGILLLGINVGRCSSARSSTFASVSDLRKLVNFDGGAGRDPVGRESLLFRKPSRY